MDAVSCMWRMTSCLGTALILLGLTACSSGRASRTVRIPAPTATAATRTAIPTSTAPVRSAATVLPTAGPTTATTIEPTVTPIAVTPFAPATLPAPPPIPSATVVAPPPPPLPSGPLPTIATTVVTYPAGWNLIAGPQGTIITGNDGPLYTMRAGDSAYEVVPSGTPLQAGAGYWAYFPQSASESLPIVAAGPITIPLAENGSVMAGDPWNTPLSVTSSPQVLSSYDPRTSYHTTTMVLPGQGVWVYSFAAGSLMIQPPAP